MSEDEIILMHVLQCRSVDLVLHKPALTDAQQEQFNAYKRRRAAGEPLQYILGTCNFMGLELAVNPSVLIPRPETELLVDSALKYFKGGDALELGTGSGNIAVALAKFVAGAYIISIDISAQALEVARSNARFHGVENRIDFVEGNMIEEDSLQSAAKNLKFDLIISNPPYIPTGQLQSLPRDVQKEPVAALDGGRDGLNFHRNIIKYTPGLLAEGGCLMMEFGDGQADAVKNIIESRRCFSGIEVMQDLTGRQRIIRAIR